MQRQIKIDTEAEKGIQGFRKTVKEVCAANQWWNKITAIHLTSLPAFVLLVISQCLSLLLGVWPICFYLCAC